MLYPEVEEHGVHTSDMGSYHNTDNVKQRCQGLWATGILGDRVGACPGVVAAAGDGVREGADVRASDGD